MWLKESRWVGIELNRTPTKAYIYYTQLRAYCDHNTNISHHISIQVQTKQNKLISHRSLQFIYVTRISQRNMFRKFYHQFQSVGQLRNASIPTIRIIADQYFKSIANNNCRVSWLFGVFVILVWCLQLQVWEASYMRAECTNPKCETKKVDFHFRSDVDLYEIKCGFFMLIGSHIWVNEFVSCLDLQQLQVD